MCQKSLVQQYYEGYQNFDRTLNSCSRNLSHISWCGHPRIVLQHIISNPLGSFWHIFIFSERVCCGDQSYTRYSVCARWSSSRWCKALTSSNRKLGSPLAPTGTHHYLNWVVFSTNLTKDAPKKLYHISSRLRAIILGGAVYYLLWLEFKIW